jgi:hypothetical protein
MSKCNFRTASKAAQSPQNAAVNVTRQQLSKALVKPFAVLWMRKRFQAQVR